MVASSPTASRLDRVEISGLDRFRSWLSITFDVDAEALWLTLARGKSRPALLSQGIYGLNAGLPRILDLLADLKIRSTFFVPGQVAERHPALVPEIAAAGHEIASHAYSHQPLSSFDTWQREADDLRRAKDILEAQLNASVIGFAAPVSDVSQHTLSILIAQGFVYDRSFLDDDRPYLFCNEQSELIELPISWVLDDFTFFGHNLYPQLGWGIQHPSVVGPIWRDELDSFATDGGFGCLVLHPEVIGRRTRLRMLRDVIEGFVGRSRFVRCADLAAEIRTLRPSRDGEQPPVSTQR
jgi:peptidoglycan/xylan/chitin deacetylase (PgdA/CDA1 family)